MNDAVRKIPFDQIMLSTARAHGLLKDQVTMQGHQRWRVLCRQRTMWVTDHMRSDLSMVYVARRLGYKDHSSFVHGVDKVNERLNMRCPEEANALNMIAAELGVPPFIDEETGLMVRERRDCIVAYRPKRAFVRLVERRVMVLNDAVSAVSAALQGV